MKILVFAIQGAVFLFFLHCAIGASLQKFSYLRLLENQGKYGLKRKETARLLRNFKAMMSSMAAGNPKGKDEICQRSFQNKLGEDSSMILED